MKRFTPFDGEPLHKRSALLLLTCMTCVIAGCEATSETDERDWDGLTEQQRRDYAEQMALYNKGVTSYPPPSHPDSSAMDPLFEADIGLKSGIDE